MKKTINTTIANIYALLITILFATPILISYKMIWCNIKPDTEIIKSISLLEYFGVIVSSIIIHELIHVLFFFIFCDFNIKKIKIGFQFKTLTPYAHCKKSLKIYQYKLSVVMPGVILGVIPIVIAFFTNSILLLYFGLFMLLGAGGDIIILFMLSKIPKHKKILDHSNEIGFIVID